MLRDLIEAAAGYVQYMMLLFQIRESSFPDFFVSPMDVVNYVNIDLLNVFDESSRYKNSVNIDVPLWIPLDFRLQFAIVSVMGPLFLAVIGTLFLASKIFFVWFMVLLGGAFVMILSISSKVNSSLFKTTIISPDRLDVAFYCGIAVTSVALIVGVSVLIWTYMTEGDDLEEQKKELARVVDAEGKEGVDADAEALIGNEAFGDDGTVASRKERLDHIMLLETAHVDIVATITRATYFVVLFVVGLILARVFNLSFLSSIQANNWLFALSGLVMFFAAVVLVWFILGLFRTGRELQFSIGVWLRDNFVSMLLLFVSLVYTPAVTNIISVYTCETVTCNAGYHLPIPMSSMSYSATAHYSASKGSTSCFPCNFSAYVNVSQPETVQQCPVSLQAALCGNATSDQRITADVNVKCVQVEGWLLASASIMLASFVITLPYVYFVLTERSTRVVDSEFPLDARQTEGYTHEEKYIEKVHVSDNVAKFIYDPFQGKYKFWRLWVIVQKLLIVIISVMAKGDGSNAVLRNGAVGIGLSLAVHLFYFGLVVTFRPFQRRVENIFAAVSQGLLCLASVLGVMTSVGASWPYALQVITAILIIAGPVVALLVGAVLTFKDDVLREKAREERVRLAQQKAEDETNHSGPQDSPNTDNATTQHPSSLEIVISSPLVPGSVPKTDAFALDGDGSGGSSPRATSSASLTSAAARARLGAANKYSRPKWNFVTVTGRQTWLIPGNQTPLSRFESLPKVSEIDGNGRRTLIASIRDKCAARTRLQSITSADPEGGNGTSFGGGRSGGAFGAAAANIRRTQRKNTSEESTRARDNWALAKLRVMGFLQDERDKAAKATGRGRAKSFFVGNSAKTERMTKGKRWDDFLAKLMVDGNGNSAMESSARLERQNSSTSVLSIQSDVPSPLTGGGRGAAAGAVASASAAGGSHNAEVSIGFDPLARAKEKKLKLKERMLALRRLSDTVHQQELSTTALLTPNATKNPLGSVASMDLRTPNSVRSEPLDGGSTSAAVAEENYHSIQGGAAGRRQHIQLRFKLQAIYDAQLKKLLLTQQAVDFRINKDTIQILNHFFVFLGVFALVACALTTVGWIANVNDTFFTGVTFNADASSAVQFAGFGTWDNFTQHCCCVASKDQVPSWPYYIVDVEEWLCDNNVVKERVRKAYMDGVLRNGYTIRPLCGSEFLNQCRADVLAGDLVNITGCQTAAQPTTIELLLW